jgi:hypothetical protein
VIGLIEVETEIGRGIGIETQEEKMSNEDTDNNRIRCRNE